MEQSISFLRFTGSIPEAISEAKRQKKLFVVYISGENTESAQLEHSTWTDLKVGDCIAKYCILLHIPGGSTDDANFSMIYPHKSVPSIAVIGYNGVRLWQNEGFVSAESLVSSIQKAWLSIHIQETAASVFTAALASENPDPSAVPASNFRGDSSSSNALAPSKGNEKSSSTELMVPSEMLEEGEGHGHADQDTSIEPSGSDYSRELTQDELKGIPGQHSAPVSETGGAEEDPLSATSDSHAVWTSNDRTVESPAQGLDILGNHPGSSLEGTSRLVSRDVSVGIDDEISGRTEQKNSGSDSKDASPADYCLNIRLPNGANLQAVFLKTSSLKSVKDFVDNNRTDGSSTYELAIPYPRKVFKEPDLSRSLVELGLTNRQALIVVPLRQAMDQTERSSHNPTSVASDSSAVGAEGYFTFVKKVISYVNPFSYLGGARSSLSGNDSQTRTQESSTSATSQNNPGNATSNSLSWSTSATTRNNDASRGKKPTSGFGSNIHTLKHDEDDAPFGDGNAFWNGNSTQYGGNNDDK
ncbi:hypothetical protein Dimus_000630 [Dionaea muscipula]